MFMLIYCFCQLFAFGHAADTMTFGNNVIFQVKIKNSDKYTIHAYPKLVPRLSTVNDGADVFLIRKPASKTNRMGGVSIESSKFPGYFLTASAKTMELTLSQMGETQKEKDEATFFNEYKVNTQKDTFRLFTAEYDFVCVTLSHPFDSYVGVDDDSKEFADSCSFYKRAASTEESDRATKGSDLTDMVEIQLANGDGKTFGIKAGPDMNARIGFPSDLFTLHHPGLFGGESTVSFESNSKPNYYLQTIEKDVYLKLNSQTDKYKRAASFTLEKSLDNPNFYAIHPLENSEFALGHTHIAPFNVRLFLNNNTAQFDKEVLWKLKSNGFPLPAPHFNIFSHPELADKDSNATFDPFVHEQLLKLIANPMQQKFEFDEDVASNMIGRLDLNLLTNPSSVWHSLVELHVDNVLRNDDWLHHRGDFAIHHEVTEPHTNAKVTEFLDWSTCTVTCGTGEQYRMAPCMSSQASVCTPRQEWRPCGTAACPMTSSQATCPATCASDCNTVLCSPLCCTYKVKKSVAPKANQFVNKIKRKLRWKNTNMQH